MAEKILIVEDEFIVANNLRLILEQAGYKVCGVAASVDEARKFIDKHAPDIVLLDIHLKGRQTGIDLAKYLRDENIAFVYLSANSNQQILEAAKATEPYGFLVKPFREKDLLVTLDIARYRHKHNLETKLKQETGLQTSLSKVIEETADWQEAFLETARLIQSYIPFDYMVASRKAGTDSSVNGSSFLRIGFNDYQVIGVPELAVISRMKEDAVREMIINEPLDRMAGLYNRTDFTQNCHENGLKKFYADIFDLCSELSFPIFMPDGSIFSYCFFSRKESAYNADQLALLIQLQKSLATIAGKMPLAESNVSYASKQQGSTGRVAAPGKVVPSFEGIVGSSGSLLSVLDMVAQVAPVDTSVLILGESGTGKERIADCIHNQSSRKGKPLVKINCAALPQALIESELFGHEKGSFTGATDKKIGKFELASGGTIFLDEIGELPLEQQVKLLRVLQEREIERVGGKQPIKVDVRVVAATNRNLEKEVAEGRFRLDLYYRLNVFPVQLPALRERKEDIEMLAEHFATQFCRKFNRPYPGISEMMLEELEGYSWPGNIRELENIIEQSVILNDGIAEIILKRPLPKTNNPAGTAPVINSLGDIKTQQQQSEKDYISGILKRTKGRIRGKGGAAELLDQKPTTLESRIAKLGIKKEDFYN